MCDTGTDCFDPSDSAVRAWVDATMPGCGAIVTYPFCGRRFNATSPDTRNESYTSVSCDANSAQNEFAHCGCGDPTISLRGSGCGGGVYQRDRAVLSAIGLDAPVSRWLVAEWRLAQCTIRARVRVGDGGSCSDRYDVAQFQL